MKQVAKSLDAFIEAGLLERIQNPMHAARMYLLVFNGPQGGGYDNLLKLASTREGRRAILDAMKSDKASEEGHRPHLRLVKSACA